MAKVNITQVKSRIGATKTQCKNLDALGLRKMGRTVQHEASATIMGMVERVRHLVKLEMNAAPKAETAPAKKVAAPKVEAAPKAVCEAPAEVKAEAKKPAAPKAAATKAAPKAAAEKKAAAPKAAATKAAPKAAKPAAPKAPAKPKAVKKEE
jgi:ribosomal protein L30